MVESHKYYAFHKNPDTNEFIICFHLYEVQKQIKLIYVVVKTMIIIGLVKLVKLLSRVQLFATLQSIAHQAPLSMGFPRQEYWSGLPFPSPGALPNPGIEPRSPAVRAYALTSEPPGKPIIGLVLRCNTKKPVWSLEVFFILFWMVVTWTYS